jgi:hypothetical protein
MKITTITLGETQIEFHNTFLGKETVKVNGEEVSSKKSMSGTEHLFDVVEGGKNCSVQIDNRNQS